MNSNKHYTKAAQTNVRDTWLAHGWKPPSRQEQYIKRATLNNYTSKLIGFK